MVTAELNYNPYSQKTEVKFNGQEPRINSMVEKYIKSPLRDWVNDVPKIYYDEMNGYGFRFEFSGTALDYEELKKAFQKIGVYDQIELNHKNQIASREDKNRAIDELLEWLENNPNENLNYEEFRADNSGMFDTDYSLKVIGDVEVASDALRDMDVEIEVIDDIKDLDHNKLSCIPIVLYIDENTISNLQSNIKYLIAKEDVSEEQLFLWVKNSISAQKVRRTVYDLGISNPKVIDKIDDDIVLEYLRLYPISDYIYNSLNLLKDVASRIRKPIDEKNEEYSKKNVEFKLRLQNVDGRIATTKKAKEDLKEYSFYNLTAEKWKKLPQEFESVIRKWKEGKTLIKNDENAADAQAKAFDKDIAKATEKLSKICSDYKLKDYSLLEKDIKAICEHVEDFEARLLDEKYKAPCSIKNEVEIVEALKKKNVSKFIQRQEGLVDKLFNGNKPANNELEMATIYYFNDWRNLVAEKVCPHINEKIDAIYGDITKVSDGYISMYKEFLEDVYKKQIEEKEKLLSNLSTEEKNMQKSLAWIQNFEDRLVVIEED